MVSVGLVHLLWKVFLNTTCKVVPPVLMLHFNMYQVVAYMYLVVDSMYRWKYTIREQMGTESPQDADILEFYSL